MKLSRMPRRSALSLCEAAKAVRKTRTYLGAKYWALTKRRGVKKATIAIAHKILMIAYHMLIKKEEYRDLGFDYLQNRSQERIERQLVNRLQSMGYAIEKMPVEFL